MPRRRVLSSEIAHETNTFSILPTTLESYRSRLYYECAEIANAMGGTACEIAAHIDAAVRHGWALIQPIAAAATPSGKTTAEAWAHLSGLLLAACATDVLSTEPEVDIDPEKAENPTYPPKDSE